MPYADREQRRIFHREYMRERRKTLSQKIYDSKINKQYKQLHSERSKELQYEWRKNNPDKWSRIKRRSERRRWTGKKCNYSGVRLVNTVIECIYDFRDICIDITGIKHHVDHVIPLSKSGLHVPWNLEVLTATQNLQKGKRILYGS